MKNNIDKYYDFLKAKIKLAEPVGFKISENKLNDKLFDFQKFIVQLALRKGRFGLFEDCGLGKTFQQLEFGYQILRKFNKPVLITAPLGVSYQTLEQAEIFGYDLKRLDTNIKNEMYITNYEQLHKYDLSKFNCFIPDESSILKNFEGSIRNQIIEGFANTPFKLPCTATPSPNDPMELGNHSEFLNSMSRTEMLSTYFVHDGGDTSKWRLKGHAIESFWDFVGSWSIMITKPSDIGFNDKGFKLPKLNMIEHKIITEKQDNGMLFNDIAVNAINYNAGLRQSMSERLNKVVEVIEASNENWIVWVKHNAEGEYLKQVLTDSVEVKGNDKDEIKEKNLLDFAKNKFKVLITKTKIGAYGMNYQNCHNQYFPSPDFSFEQLYQGIRRSLRFKQENEVNIHINSTDIMGNVLENLKAKQLNYEVMKEQTSKSILKQYMRAV